MEKCNRFLDECRRRGYTVWQMQYRWSEPEGFHAWFYKSGAPEIEVVTHNEQVQEGKSVKIKLLVLICIFAIMLSACGAQENKSGPADTAKPDSSSAAESTLDNNVISAEKKLLTVDVTLPASFFEDSTHEEIEAAAKEQGIQKVKFNNDGSVTYTMDKAKHRELLDSIKSAADETIADILNDKETYPSFVDIKYNNDLTEFTVLCDKDKYTQFEAFAALAFYVQGNYYQAFNGVDSNAIKTIVNFVDKATGEVINTADSSQIGSGE